MKKTVIRFTPVSGYDIIGLENWLEDMAARGLRFDYTVGPLTFFCRETPVRLHFHLEPARNKTNREDRELTELFQASGWRYLGIFRKNFFVFVAQEETAPAHTDPEVWSDTLKRFFRQKLLGGVGLALINLFLGSFFWSSSFSLFNFRYFWAELLPLGLIPWLLSLVGLTLVDLAYFQGLFSLWQLRRRVRQNKPLNSAPGSRLSGALAALAVVPLALVSVEIFWVFTDLAYTPYPLEGSGFVTLTDLEGPGLPLPDEPSSYSMDYISHSNSPLTPEDWQFRQSGDSPALHTGGPVEDTPSLTIRATRYLFPFAAEHRVWEWQSYGRGSYRALSLPSDLDEAWISEYDGCVRLILRQGGTVLRAEYSGTQDFSLFLNRFAEMFDNL